MLRALRVSIERDSVSGGDDTDAPHRLEFGVPATCTLRQLVQHLLDTHYLPQIQGGRATWYLETGVLEGLDPDSWKPRQGLPLAVIAQQWLEPRYLISGDAMLVFCLDLELDPTLMFRYWCQADPEEVARALEEGRRLPNRYGLR